MSTLLLVLIIIASILLIGAVLLQNPKSGGAFTSSSVSQIMGVRQTGDFLETSTWVLVASLMIFSLSVNLIAKSPTEDSDNPMTRSIEKAKEELQKQPGQDLLLDSLTSDPGTSTVDTLGLQ